MMILSNNSEIGAIFVDLENMDSSGERWGVKFSVAPILEKILQNNSLILRKAYGDWGRYAKYRQDFIQEAFDLVQLASGKNGLDIHISVDAIEAIFLHPYLTIIFLVTGDADYCPLARMLRKHGKKVVGISWNESLSKTFRAHCDEFWHYEELVGLPIHPDFNTQLQQAVNELGLGKCVKLSTLKTAILRHDPTFNEKTYGYTKFSEFVAHNPYLQLKSSNHAANDLVQLPNKKFTNVNGVHQGIAC